MYSLGFLTTLGYKITVDCLESNCCIIRYKTLKQDGVTKFAFLNDDTYFRSTDFVAIIRSSTVDKISITSNVLKTIKDIEVNKLEILSAKDLNKRVNYLFKYLEEILNIKYIKDNLCTFLHVTDTTSSFLISLEEFNETYNK